MIKHGVTCVLDNEYTVKITSKGRLDIFDENDNEIWSGCITDIPEIKEILLNKR